MTQIISYHYFAEVDSTNQKARELALAGAPGGTVVCAESQTAGRGRRGKNWESPPGTSVYTSMLLYPQLNGTAVSSLTLVAALAVRSAIARCFPLEPMIKWPNDIVLDGKKVCGILSEYDTGKDGRPFVIVGIGINVYPRPFPPELEKKAACLASASPSRAEPDRRQALTEAVWEEFLRYYEILSQEGDFSLLKEEYENYLVNRRRRVEVQDPLGAYCGTAVGIDASGALLVETKEGVKRVDAGEVSVRGVYGYI